MSGTGRVYVDTYEKDGDIKSTHKYKVTVKFDIAFNYGGWYLVDDGALWSISADAQAAQTGHTKIDIYSGNGTYVWQNVGSKTFYVTMPGSGQTKTINVGGSIYMPGVNPSEINASGTFTLPAVTWQWTVSYNANGGNGAPSSQTKTYGSTLTLSSTKPTRTGYTFQGWATSESATSATYSAGGSYTSNAAVTLYAVWKINTYTVSYNANGGDGAPSNQTKTYGKNLTLSSTKPTRTSYDFQGWATSSSSTTVSYKAGDTYTGNAALALYAVWKLAYWSPRISSLTVTRTDSSGNVSTSGEYAKVSFSWSVCTTAGTNSVSSCTVAYGSKSTTVSLSGTSGSKSVVVGSVGTDTSTTFKVSLKDTKGNTGTLSYVLPTVAYVMDVRPKGTGVAFGKAAETDGEVQSLWNYRIQQPKSGTNAYYTACRTDTGVEVNFGVGSGGTNHGVWSTKTSRWLIHSDGSSLYLNETLNMTSRKTATNSVNYIGANPIASTSSDTRANWVDKGLGVAYYNTANCLNGQPNQWGYLLNLTTGSGTEIGQIFFPYTSANLFIRGGNGSTTAMPSTWYKILSTGNTADYVTAKSKLTSSTGWGYIKFNSGIAICYYIGRRTSTVGVNQTYTKLPFTLDHSVCVGGASTDGYNNSYVMYTRNDGTNVDMYYYSSVKVATTYYILAIGRWDG